MLLKLNARTGFILIMVVAVFVVLILIGAKSYFNTELLKSLNEGCHDQNGTVEMQTTFLNLDYSFSCE